MEKTRPPSAAIILVDDDAAILLGSTLMLRQAGLNQLQTIDDNRELLPFLAEHDAGVIILDLHMPHLSGQQLLKEITANYPHIPVIIMTGANEMETAIECMKSGAFDYIVKPVEANRFIATVRKACELHDMRREIDSLRESLLCGKPDNGQATAAMTTRSPRMRAIAGYLQAVAPSEQPVLITGETGTGKEVIAGLLHQQSGRSGEFVAVNVAGLDDLMFADTLFGHKKGAFTGADQARDGMVVRAAGGTLFLDEIGELSSLSQVKLLRLLQEGEYHPVGADTTAINRSRIIVATNRDLQAAITEGTFRRDLFYRLCTHRVHLPPLRERSEDIPLLLETFLEEAALSLQKSKPTCPPELFSYLCSYHFPGNIRELRAMTFDAVTRHKGGVLSMLAFREATGSLSPPGESATLCGGDDQWLNLSGRFPTLKEIEQCLVSAALSRATGNQRAAAALLGISRQALNQRLSKK